MGWISQGVRAAAGIFPRVPPLFGRVCRDAGPIFARDLPLWVGGGGYFFDGVGSCWDLSDEAPDPVFSLNLCARPVEEISTNRDKYVYASASNLPSDSLRSCVRIGEGYLPKGYRSMCVPKYRLRLVSNSWSGPSGPSVYVYPWA